MSCCKGVEGEFELPGAKPSSPAASPSLEGLAAGAPSNPRRNPVNRAQDSLSENECLRPWHGVLSAWPPVSALLRHKGWRRWFHPGRKRNFGVVPPSTRRGRARWVPRGPTTRQSICLPVSPGRSADQVARERLRRALGFAAASCCKRAWTSLLPKARSAANIAACSARGLVDSCSQL